MDVKWKDNQWYRHQVESPVKRVKAMGSSVATNNREGILGNDRLRIVTYSFQTIFTAYS